MPASRDQGPTLMTHSILRTRHLLIVPPAPTGVLALRACALPPLRPPPSSGHCSVVPVPGCPQPTLPLLTMVSVRPGTSTLGAHFCHGLFPAPLETFERQQPARPATL